MLTTGSWIGILVILLLVIFMQALFPVFQSNYERGQTKKWENVVENQFNELAELRILLGKSQDDARAYQDKCDEAVAKLLKLNAILNDRDEDDDGDD